MDQISETADLLKALADPTRLKILTMLSEKGCMLCVNAISHHLGISQSAVSQHLKVLKQAKLVKGERKGYHVHYSVEKGKVKSICDSLMTTFK
jgi:ArsR family transcriptional regulator